MNKKHTEAKLEDAIEHCLITQQGFSRGESKDYDTALALEPTRVIAFFKATQEKTWTALASIHGAETERIVFGCLG